MVVAEEEEEEAAVEWAGELVLAVEVAWVSVGALERVAEAD